jgi:hypothetical protein
MQWDSATNEPQVVCFWWFRFNFYLDRLDPNNVLEIEFQNKKQWRVSVSFSLQTWHSIACSWHPSDGLLCLIDLSSVLKGNQRYPESTYGPLTLGKSDTIPNTNAHASVSTLAIWERKLTSSEFQSLYTCMGIMPRKYHCSFCALHLFKWLNFTVTVVKAYI